LGRYREDQEGTVFIPSLRKGFTEEVVLSMEPTDIAG
jgi:hypothetical protein